MWLFGGLVATLLLLGAQIQLTSARYVSELRSIAHSRDVQMAVTDAVADARATEADLRGFLLSGDAAYLDGHILGLDTLQRKLRELGRLVADDPQQKANAQTLAGPVASMRQDASDLRRVYVSEGADAAGSAFARLTPDAMSHAFQQQAEAMLADEARLLEARRALAAVTASNTRWLGMTAVGICLFELTFGFWFLLREQRRRTLGQALLERSNAELAATLSTSRQLADSMRNLSEFGEMLQGCRNLDEAIVGVRSTLVHLLPGCAGTLNLINPSQNLVEAMTSWGTHAIETSPLFAPDDCWSLRRGQPFPPNDAACSFICKHVVLPDPLHPDAAYLCVPLVANGEIFGVLHLTSPHDIGAETRGVMIAAAEQISLTLANLRLQESLRTQSLRDALTGLFNRRYLESSLEREVLRAQRHALTFAVLMIDIDDFKRFNDEHGHDAGDALLSEFGRLLQRSLRTEDIVCRYGGEEFIAILTDADPDIARQRAEAIRAEVQRLELRHRNEICGRITVSIGIALYPTHGTLAADLLHRADKALYASKRAGKDRVTLASHTVLLSHPAGRGER
ncbi:MAG: GGDEF domain-containing protein [Dokdonella sp.]